MVEPRSRVGTDQGQDREGLAHVLVVYVAPDREHARVAGQGGKTLRLGVDPDEGLTAQDAHVGEHLPLVVEEGGVAAGAGREGGYVVRHLPLKVVGRLAARE